MTRSVWDELVGQQGAASYLRTAATSGSVAHAYLFVGPPGAGKHTAAKALACAVLCDDGCGACGTCVRVKRGVHPDVHEVSPEGAGGYLVNQVREIIHDVSLAPMEGSHKIYLISDADTFNDSSANAFLKTLEEPPEDVIIVLMTHSYDAVLPTIASRCQVVRFRRMAPSEAASLLASKTGADESAAAAALAAAGGVVARAAGFLASPLRRTARDTILKTLKDLSAMDELDVLEAAKELLTAVRAPLEGVKAAHAQELAERAEFVGKSSLAPLEQRQKRELTSREREGIGEVLNVTESWLRDCLTISQGVSDLVVNYDARDAMEQVGSVISPSAVATAMNAVNEARRRISYNVSPQLAIEAMLFDIREVLRCPR